MSMKKFEVEGHEPSFLPEGSEWELAWCDEFDGTELDTTKWSFRRNFWGKPFIAYTDEGVVLDGKSNLEIHLIKKDGKFCSAQLQTGALTFDKPIDPEDRPKNTQLIWPFASPDKPKFMHRYGYYEVRCKFQTQPKWWSAFWLQAPAIGTTYDPAYSGIEVDIMECFERDGEITSGNIIYGKQHDPNFYMGDGRVNYFMEDTPDRYHRFGVDWSEDGYVFYCDGKETSRANKFVSKVEQFILLTTEPRGYRQGDGTNYAPELDQAVLPDCFTVDYVRVFDRK